MNLNLEFSINEFIDYLKNLDHNKQKRMLFMIEAELTIFDDFDYNTNFGVYPNYQHMHLKKLYVLHITKIIIYCMLISLMEIF
ncbi:hypothetical protein SAMN05421856_101595 [Chryseobacterium taichungense]|uniref:Uncharacterized protein n=1 Tax=Chryseobacterium taichungense TaxID=295069 RepID=A0A1H7WB22_9FLAO|nr:hypothetical protein SAMN05421856_101595 [Chryseobacterium taichungense]